MTHERFDWDSYWRFENNRHLLPPVRHGPFQEMSMQQMEAVLDAKIRKHMKDFFGDDTTKKTVGDSVGSGNAGG